MILIYPFRCLSRSTSESNILASESIRRGDTIATILNRLDISSQIPPISGSGSRAMRQLRPTIYAQTTADGELLSLRYFFGNEELFLMEKRTMNLR